MADRGENKQAASRTTTCILNSIAAQTRGRRTTQHKCQRKKKCIRYMEALHGNGALANGSGMDDAGNMSQLSDDDDDDEELGGASCGSGDETETNKMADNDDTESMSQSLSSPGCLSGLSSVQSPSTTTSLASPLNMNMLTSPATPALPSATSNIGPLPVNNSNEQAASSSQSRSAPGSGTGSSSGSTCSISNTPNTSSTASPVTSATGTAPTSVSERAMMLGTRFSHLGMGLTLPVCGSNPEQLFQSHTHLAAVSLAGSSGSGSSSSSTPTSLATNGFNSYTGSVTAGGSIKTIVPNAAASVSAPAPATGPATSLHRNPIGANPRDINNPLSINQLTKRREDNNIVILGSCDPQSASVILRHNAAHNPYTHTHPHPHPHPHHALFSSSFSQHFQQQLNNHLSATSSSGSSIGSVVQPIDTPALNSMKRRNTSDSPAATGNSATPNATETGAISVS